MIPKIDAFLPLPVSADEDGKKRLTGFEFEYTGIAIEECAQLIADQFQGTVHKKTPLIYEVLETTLGKIEIKADWQLAQKISKRKFQSYPKFIAEPIRQGIEQAGQTKTFVVPWEIVTDPLEEKQLEQLETLRSLFYHYGAKGVSSSFAFVFGTHINCDIPSTSIESILDYFRAFLILYPILTEELSVQSSRRALSFIDPFPADYTKRVLDPSYQPDWNEFIDDYLRFNNTRNRALDLLPLFCALYPETQNKVAPYSRKLLKPRKTFHYRLPNSDFGNPDWRVSHVWNSWIAVENLANDKEKLQAMQQEYNWGLRHPIAKWWRKKKELLKEYFRKD